MNEAKRIEIIMEAWPSELWEFLGQDYWNARLRVGRWCVQVIEMGDSWDAVVDFGSTHLISVRHPNLYAAVQGAHDLALQHADGLARIVGLELSD